MSSSTNHPAVPTAPAVKLGSFLTKYGTNLTKLAADGKLDPVVGRNDEIERSIQVLSRRRKNNPCLIGEPGVGKSAIGYLHQTLCFCAVHCY